MARIKITPLIDGPRHLVLYFYVSMEDGEADLENYELVNPLNYGLPLHKTPYVLEKVCYGFAGFDADIRFDSSDGAEAIWVLPEASGVAYNFTEFGGLADRTGSTGRLLFTMYGSGVPGKPRRGSMVLRLKARQKLKVNEHDTHGFGY